MGNGIFNPPPPSTGAPTLPDIPIPDFVTTGKAVAQGASESTFIDDWIAKYFTGKAWSFTLVWGAITSVVTEAVGLWVKLWTQLQATDNLGLYDLLAAVIEDVVGVSVSGASMRSAYLHQGRGGALTAVGAALFNSLESAVKSSSGPVTALSGYASARSFTGWLTELSIRQGNVALFSSMIPEEYRFMEGVVEYGEQLSKNLGFGRLARRAFTPMIDAIVAKPLTWSMNATYRPNMLNEGQIIHLLHSGNLSQPDAEQMLTYHGYTDADIARLITGGTKALSTGNLLELVRAGTQDAGGILPLIQAEGYTADQAQLIWTAVQEGALLPVKHHFIGLLLHQLTAGFIDLPTFNSATDSMNLLAVERSYWQLIAQQTVGVPRKHLSEGQWETAFLEGLTDMSTIQQYWTRSGYSFQDVQLLTEMLLVKMAGGRKTTSGRVARKHLTEAQVEKAVKAGIITLAQADLYWTNLGYTQTDVQILHEILAAESGAAAPPVPGTPT